MLNRQALKNREITLEKILSVYPVMLSIAKEFDGKIMNKKFVDAYVAAANESADKVYASYFRDSWGGKFHNMEIRLYGVREELVRIHNVEYMNVVVNKRFVYPAFEERALAMRKYYQRELDALREDLRTGETRLNEYNALIAKINALKSTFSEEFKTVNCYEFKKAS